MPTIVIQVELAALEQFQRAAALLGTGEARKIAVWALNQVGRKLDTAVRRQTAKQIGLSAPKLRSNFDTDEANSGSLEFKIMGTGKYYGLEDFGARDAKRAIKAKGIVRGGGVVAAPWGVSRQFPHTFLIGARAFKRVGRSRYPLHKLSAGAVPREMERDAVPVIADMAIDHELPEAVERKLAQFMP